jgi:hypothetical protein
MKMLAFLKERVSNRKLRLLATGNCRWVSHFLRNKYRYYDFNEVESILDAWAEGALAPRIRDAALDQLYRLLRASGAFSFLMDAFQSMLGPSGCSYFDPSNVFTSITSFEVRVEHAEDSKMNPHYAELWTAAVAAEVIPEGVSDHYGKYLQRKAASQAHQQRLIRDVFGNPFQPPPTMAREWLGWSEGTAPRMAEAIYHEHAFERLPILADALEDAGCDNAAILTHCRGPGEHVRGCWVVDLLLGKE